MNLCCKKAVGQKIISVRVWCFWQSPVTWFCRSQSGVDGYTGWEMWKMFCMIRTLSHFIKMQLTK